LGKRWVIRHKMLYIASIVVLFEKFFYIQYHVEHR
jgi:hypothetical protein